MDTVCFVSLYNISQQKRDGCYDNSIILWLFQLHVFLVVRRLLCKIDKYASIHSFHTSLLFPMMRMPHSFVIV